MYPFTYGSPSKVPFLQVFEGAFPNQCLGSKCVHTCCIQSGSSGCSSLCHTKTKRYSASEILCCEKFSHVVQCLPKTVADITKM